MENKNQPTTANQPKESEIQNPSQNETGKPLSQPEINKEIKRDMGQEKA